MSSPSTGRFDSPLARTPSRGSQGSATPGTSSRSSKTVLGDKYVLGEELGRGAFGQVFKGQDQSSGAAVAVKQLALSGISADSLQNIMGEIDLLKNLNHRNIVKYIGSFKTRSHLYIILEYMENGALSSHIKPSKFGAFPESLVAVYIQQVLQGLAYLHEQGVVHRDIKGANILTAKEGVVKLADFGVAAKLTEQGGDMSVVGTPYWMAPEVVEMTGLSAASDIWSVGALAIELLTGQPPYFDLHPMSALYKIVQDERPPLPSDITPDMESFLLLCFQKDPSKRPGARTLLNHHWVQYNRKTLRTSWSRTKGLKAKGIRTDGHIAVSAAVELMLQAEADKFEASARQQSLAASQASDAAGVTPYMSALPPQSPMSSRMPPPMREHPMQPTIPEAAPPQGSLPQQHQQQQQQLSPLYPPVHPSYTSPQPIPAPLQQMPSGMTSRPSPSAQPDALSTTGSPAPLPTVGAEIQATQNLSPATEAGRASGSGEAPVSQQLSLQSSSNEPAALASGTARRLILDTAKSTQRPSEPEHSLASSAADESKVESFTNDSSTQKQPDVEGLLQNVNWSDVQSSSRKLRNAQASQEDTAEVRRCGAFWLCCGRPPTGKKQKGPAERRKRRQ